MESCDILIQFMAKTAYFKRKRKQMINEKKFWDLVRSWEYQTQNDGSKNKFFHPSLGEIIAMGKDAIPLLLKAVKDNWYLCYALHKITNEWPVKDDYAGNPPMIIDCWLQWGKKNGYSI